MYSLLSLRMISSRSVHILNQPLVHCVFHLVITEVLSLQRAYPRWSVTVNPKDGKCGYTYVNNPIHSSVLAKHLEFRKREELFCANDGAERERERERRRLHNCQVLLVVHYRCCLWLGTVSIACNAYLSMWQRTILLQMFNPYRTNVENTVNS